MILRVTWLFGALYIIFCPSKFVAGLTNMSTKKGAQDLWLNKASTFIIKH